MIMNTILRILLVDRDEDDFILTRVMLSEAQGMNYKLYWASTYETAEQELKRDQFDVVLVEYDLGLQSGLELIRDATSRNYAAPFIVYTGRGSKEVELEAIQAGATLYLPKDEAGPHLLKRAIHFAIERKQLEIERKKAEEALRESQILLKAVLEGTQDPVYVKDRDSRILLANPALARVVGKPVEEIIGKTDSEYYGNSEVGQALREHDLMVIESGQSQAVEEVALTIEGYRTFLSSKAPYFDAAGKIIGIVGISRDITERKRMEMKLAESEEKLRNLIQYAPAAIYEVDFRGRRFTSVNDVMCQLSGYTREELLNMNPFDLLDEPSRIIFQKRIDQWLAGEKPDSNVEYKVRVKDGRELYVILNTTFVSDDSRRPVGATVIGHDITERKALEERLTYQASLLENIHDAVIATDTDLRITSWNRAAERLYGYSAEEVMGKLAIKVTRSVIDPEKRQKALQLMVETGVYNEEIVQYAKDGRRIMIETYALPIRDSNGKITGYVAANRDITSRKQAEEALLQNQELLVDYLESTHDLFFALNYDGRFIYANRRYCETLGLEQQEIIGKDFWELFPRYTGTIMEVNYRKAMEERLPIHFQTEGIYTDKWFEISVYPTRDGISVFVIDRTRTHQAEKLLIESNEALQAERAKLEAIVENLDVGVLITEPGETVLSMNPAALKMHGFASSAEMYTRREQFAANFEMLYPDGRVVPVEERPGSRALRGDFFKDLELQVRDLRTGRQWFGSWCASPVRNSQGDIQLLVFTIYDITRQKEVEEALKVKNEQLIRSNQALQDFAFIASHHLKEPLRKVQTFGSMLLSSYSPCLDEQGQDYIQRMQSATGRMERMLDGLLDYSRVTTGQGKPFEKIELSSLIQGVLSDLEVRIQETSGLVEVGELPEVEGDRIQIRQLFQNLVGNALKFHRPDVPPVVKVYSRPSSEDYIELIVEDNGIGFDMSRADLLFQPFNRLVGRSDYEGTGIGLAICQKIVERHGGSISAEGNPGKGSVFIVTLPLVKLKVVEN